MSNEYQKEDTPVEAQFPDDSNQPVYCCQPPEPRSKVTLEHLFAVSIAFLMIGILVGSFLSPAKSVSPTPQQVSDNHVRELQKSELDFKAAEMTRDVERVKQIYQIQKDTAQSCIVHGGVPVFVGGNVDCKR